MDLVERKRLLKGGYYALLVAFFWLYVGASVAAEEKNFFKGRRYAVAVRTNPPPQIDGYVDPLWLKAPAQQDFVQRFPHQGEKAFVDTKFYIMYDDDYLYLLFIMIDPEPEAIPARLVERDYMFYPDDSINFYLDTFNDSQRAYYFSTNPLGVEQDGLISENGNKVDMSWDCVFHVAARRNKYGWVAEFAIPFKSLRFDNSRKYQVWGFNVWRIRKVNREISYWSLVDQNYQMFRLDKGGVLIGIDRQVSSGNHLDFLPFGTLQMQTRSGVNQWLYKGGLDLRYGITSDVTLNVTLNPDFGQVEIDEEQINLDKRYELFLQEKRPFFLENTNLFQLPIQTFYSRRIGAGSDIKGGVKLTGKSGPYSFGLIGVVTGDWRNRGLGDPNQGPPEEIFTVLRIQRDIFRSSNVGFMFTGVEENLGGRNYSFNRSASVDWNLFIGAHQFFTGQMVRSATYGPGGDGNAARFTLGHYDQTFLFYLDGYFYDADFEVNGTGFFWKLPDKGHQQWTLYAETHPIVNRRFLRSWGLSAGLGYIRETLEQNPSVGVNNRFWLEFPDQSRIEFAVANYQDVETDYRAQPFKDIVYRGTDVRLSLQTDIGKPVSLRLTLSQNRQYYFQTYSTGYDRGLLASVMVKPLSNTFFELSFERRMFLDDRFRYMPMEAIGQNDAQVWIFRGRYLFTRDVFARIFAQYTNGAEFYEYVQDASGDYYLRYTVFDRISANILLGWRFTPLSAAYLVYTEEWNNFRRAQLGSRNRILFFKLSYLFSW